MKSKVKKACSYLLSAIGLVKRMVAKCIIWFKWVVKRTFLYILYKLFHTSVRFKGDVCTLLSGLVVALLWTLLSNFREARKLIANLLAH